MKKLLTAALLAMVTLAGCNCASVAGDEVGVVEDTGGVRKDVLSPGLHMLPPWTSVYKYRIDDQVFAMNSGKSTGADGQPLDPSLHDEDELLVTSKDSQKVWISLTLRYSLDRTKILTECENAKASSCGIHIEARDHVEAKWIRPELIRITKDLATTYTAKEIYAEKRPELNDKIEKMLHDDTDIGAKGIIIKMFVLDGVRLEDAYEKEISATVLQDQRKSRAEKEAAAAKEEAEAAKWKAQAEVETRTQQAEAAKQEEMKKAEAARFTAEQNAIGLLAQGKAEAEVAALKRDADYDGAAGDRRMKVQIAEARAKAAQGLFPQATVVGGQTVDSVIKGFLDSMGN